MVLLTALGLATSISLASAAPRESILTTESGTVRIVGVDVGDEDIGQPSCDVNGDGVLDLVISAGEGDGPENLRTGAGEVYVFYGRRGAWTGALDPATQADVRIIGAVAFGTLGKAVACGDVNGDGYGDLVICAPNSNGPGGTRVPQSGEARLVFGGPALPAVLDLAIDPQVVIYGAESPDRMCYEPRLGDVNGDGRLDLLLDAQGALDVSRLHENAGRVHILFGRTNWPAVVDLASEGDVRIYGGAGTAFGDMGDRLGSDLAAGDLDGDGIDELLAGAPAGDGPGDSRHNAGEVYVFRGRPAWPPVIDLAVDSPDTYVTGADVSDAAAPGPATLLVADLDSDGDREMLVGSAAADGPGNLADRNGEVRRVEFGPALPSSIDLATDAATTWYGGDPMDGLGKNLSGGDVNGDGMGDLVFGISEADGFTNGEFGAGEIAVVFGRPSLAPEFDFAAGDEDVVIYGTAENPSAGTRALSDINGDGIKEMVISTSADIFSRATVWIVSPVDTDRDGLRNLPDNCPLAWNPDQRDADGDLVGDACDPDLVDTSGDLDADGIADVTDNCPHRANPLQTDADADGAGDLCDVCPGISDPDQADRDRDGSGDACDCQPDDPNDATPREVAWMEGERVGGNGVRWTWREAEGAEAYSITRGSLGALPSGSYGSCLAEGIFGTSYDDAAVPAPGEGIVYLVQAQSYECGLGDLGERSGEAPRVNPDPAACGGAAFTDARAVAETTVYGTVTGTLSDTLSSNDQAETIVESLSGGNPSSRFSRLEHRWRFDVPAGRSVELHVEGWRTRSPDGDAFVWDYSTDGGTTWTPVSIAPFWIADKDADRVAAFPASLAGPVWVRVVDTDRTAGNQALDEVAVDELFVRSVP